MPRPQRSQQAVGAITKRFVRGIELLGLSRSQIWPKLGYANGTTIGAVWNGTSLPDFVRLAEHADVLCDASGRALNLHWVITGVGEPLIPAAGTKRPLQLGDDDIIAKIQRLTPEQSAALNRLLGEFV